MKTPPLRNDCFALPAGVDWTPVDDALAHLRDALGPVVGASGIAPAAAEGRVLAEAPVARRANPPFANSAVDGFGFAHHALPAGDPVELPLADGRAAAGAPYPGTVPPGHAVRILTGAALPAGVDTVILEEDVAAEAGSIRFHPGIRRGANCRKAGEDMREGQEVLPARRILRPQDIALLTAADVAEVKVFRPLKVAVLSTGTELADTGARPDAHQIPDSNRPMLLSLIARWGMEPVDLGRATDDPSEVRARLDTGALGADAIVTTGGASAGDEDHISAALRTAGAMNLWRIAVKPGRPLALGLWSGTPVFGLPGNPVAAFVCALVFARPALFQMAGAGWVEPLRLQVPAAFAKSKKPGRREYLRARLDANGHAEVFHSEGSGLISGLSWSDGLVELPDGAAEIVPGTPVAYLPYSGWGL